MIHKYFLPKMSRILKLRKKKITMSQDDLSCEVFTKMDGVCSTIPVGWSRATAFPFLLARTKAFRSIDNPNDLRAEGRRSKLARRFGSAAQGKALKAIVGLVAERPTHQGASKKRNP